MPSSAPDDPLPPANSQPQLDLIAACAFGLEAVVAAELRALGYKCKTLQNGRVLFRTEASAICRANLWLRSADRVLLRLGAFPATDFGQLYDATRSIPWAEWLPADATFPVNGKSIRSRLSSVPACQKIVKKAIVDSLAEAYGQDWHPETGAPFHVEVALLEDQVTLSIDTTGPSLHKRGYRTLNAEAQLKETLAAGLVWLSGWQTEQPLWDPFCGTGTIPIEAALWGRRMAPGLNRVFAAEQWPALAADGWRLAREEARDLALPSLPQRIMATDINPAALSLARCHAQQAGVAEDIHFEPRDFAAIGSRKTGGKLIGNPPYGERMGSVAEAQDLYRSLPAVMARLPGWSCYILTSHPRFEQVAGVRADRRRKLYNGRLECWLYQFERHMEQTVSAGDESTLDQAPAGEEGEPQEAASTIGDSLELTGEVEAGPGRQRFPRGGGRPERMEAQQEVFSQRLANRARHLRKWPTRRGITCYRLYDRDVPEVPLTVDRYEDHLHVVEHERPHERSDEQHAEWLARMASGAADVMGLPPERVHVKSLADPRPPLYEGSFDPAGVIEVHEGGLKFYVSLRDFSDTGLFLDERLLRKWVRDNAAGKRVLNLFAYTGAVSVCAAAGSARHVTTVDLFASHLTWARQNLTLNGLLPEGAPDQASVGLSFVAADGLSYLEESDDGLYDLAIVSPPASSDRSSSGEWDLARDHVALLNRLRARMAPGGQVLLLSRARRFKLAPEAWPTAGVREISQQTVPEDFRNERIHRCWRLSASPGETAAEGEAPEGAAEDHPIDVSISTQ